MSAKDHEDVLLEWFGLLSFEFAEQMMLTDNEINFTDIIELIQSVALCPELSTGDFRYVDSYDTSAYVELHPDLDMLLSVEDAAHIEVCIVSFCSLIFFELFDVAALIKS